jgi:hypothetical protein
VRCRQSAGSAPILSTPETLPPGRLRLATSPSVTGSSPAWTPGLGDGGGRRDAAGAWDGGVIALSLLISRHNKSPTSTGLEDLPSVSPLLNSQHVQMRSLLEYGHEDPQTPANEDVKLVAQKRSANVRGKDKSRQSGCNEAQRDRVGYADEHDRNGPRLAGARQPRACNQPVCPDRLSLGGRSRRPVSNCRRGARILDIALLDCCGCSGLELAGNLRLPVFVQIELHPLCDLLGQASSKK